MLIKAGIYQESIDFCSDGQEALDKIIETFDEENCFYVYIFMDFNMP
jgi:CheY-like chemotaxis protein